VTAPARARPRPPRIPACEGSRHAGGVYQGLDLRWYVGNVEVVKCPWCGKELRS
jgi:hypothetical protein